MRGRLGFSLVVAMLAALSLASSAFGGGVAVEFDSTPTGAEAGVAWTFGFTVRSAHEDAMLQSGLTPLIVATNPVADQQVETTATAEGAPGHYVATLTFPATGAWQWRIQPFGRGENYSLSLPGPLTVREKGASAPAKARVSALLADAKGMDDSFQPRELTVPAGTTVRWSMAGKNPHTVTAADGAFSSGNLKAGQVYEVTFAEPGTYAYYCEYHGTKNGQGMYGKLTVTASAGQSEAVAAALPRTGASGFAWVGVLLAALAAGGVGMALRWGSRSRAR